MPTALLIDDDEHCRTPLAERLRRRGWEVLEAGDGERGLALAVAHCPSLIFCELLLPQKNGFQVCRAAREHLELRHSKLVAIASRHYAADHAEALAAGADECHSKETVLEELETIAERLSAPIPSNSAPMAETREDGATRIRFWGVRGSIPTPGQATVIYGGNTSCVEVRASGEIIVLDAGTGIRALGLALAREFQGVALNLTVLISHTHWDHIQGFPFFVPAYAPQNRLRILGYEGARDGLATTLAGQMESPYFPIALQEMPGNIVIEELREMAFEIGSVRVEACFSKHPGVCVGYRLFTPAGSLVYLPDNEWSADDSTAPDEDDCSQNANLLRFIRGADVLIIDAQYDNAEYQSHRGWGHGCVDDVVRLALASQVQQLYLFHHDPAHDDEAVAALVEHARSLVGAEAGSRLVVEAAKEGAEILLKAKRGVA